MKIPHVWLWAIASFGLHMIAFSLMRIIAWWLPQIHNVAQITFFISALFAGGLIAFAGSGLISNLFLRIVVFVLMALLFSVVLFYFPYALPYTGAEPGYQRLSPGGLRMYLHLLNYFPLFVGLALVIFAAYKGLQKSG
jgi:hypothetical protein